MIMIDLGCISLITVNKIIAANVLYVEFSFKSHINHSEVQWFILFCFSNPMLRFSHPQTASETSFSQRSVMNVVQRVQVLRDNRFRFGQLQQFFLNEQRSLTYSHCYLKARMVQPCEECAENVDERRTSLQCAYS
jgi:hypothetical protein